MAEDEKFNGGGWDGDIIYDRNNALLQKTRDKVEMTKEILIESHEIIVSMQNKFVPRRVSIQNHLIFLHLQ